MKKQLKNEVVLRYPSIVRPKNPNNANDFLLSSFLICLECEGSIGLQEVERDNWHESQEADGLLELRGHTYWPLDLKNLGMLDWITLTQPLCNRQQLCPLNPSYACQKAVRPLPFMSIITLNLLEPNASFTRQANQRERQKKSFAFLFFSWPQNTIWFFSPLCSVQGVTNHDWNNRNLLFRLCKPWWSTFLLFFSFERKVHMSIKSHYFSNQNVITNVSYNNLLLACNCKEFLHQIFVSIGIWIQQLFLRGHT